MKGRQTRHSKVYTSRGPRDRRVRLSALTAIQFYDVQDRLGYDRPSEAVDWLMLKAKASIEALPQKPNAVTPYSAGVAFGKNQDLANSDQEKLQHLGFDSVNNSPSFPMESLSLLSTDYIHMPEFSYELGNDAASPFPVVGSQLENVMLQEQTATRPDCEFVPSSCLDQVVFSASLFSKQTSPVKRSVFSSAIASSMEDGPRKHRVLDWPFMTPPSIGLRSSFQIGE